MHATSKHQIPGSPAPGQEHLHIPRRGERQPKEAAPVTTADQHALTGTNFATVPEVKAEMSVESPPPQNFSKVATEVANRLKKARSFGATADGPSSQVFGSLPSMTKHCMAAARKWQSVPDNVSDTDALAQGIITPEMLQLIMQVVQQLMQGCLSNSRAAAWSRIVGYRGAKEIDRLGDHLRMNGIINNWMDRLGIPRDVGDVVSIRRAITQTADGITQDDFNQVQAEALFLTI